MTKLAGIATIAIALIGALMMSACKTTQPPAPARIIALPVRVVEPTPPPVVAPPPVVVSTDSGPDYTWLEGHSSRSVPVPVQPVEVEDIGPIFDGP